MKRQLLLLALLSLVAAPAAAQRAIVYDTAAAETPAAITCGFCAGERFGVVFRELPSTTRPGLRVSEFPLRLDSIVIAVASATVDALIQCMGSTSGGEVTVALEVYAGPTRPTGSIMGNEPTGPWPGETLVWSDAATPLQLSVETSAGTGMYNIMLNTVPVDVMVASPNTYLRVVVTVPPGPPDPESYCEIYIPGATRPAALAIRDNDGRIDDEINFILAVGGIGDGWYWSEDVPDTLGGGTGINGDWVIRLNVTPMPVASDAGTPMVDAGMADAGTPDAGTTTMDSGTPPPVDAGGGDMCTTDAQCAGGERCIENMCRRIACTAAADCLGGMTCVEGMCRNLCSSNAECLGGEVCDMAAGHCVPVGEDDGGCGCRAVGSRSMTGLGWLTVGFAALVFRARRRR